MRIAPRTVGLLLACAAGAAPFSLSPQPGVPPAGDLDPSPAAAARPDGPSLPAFKLTGDYRLKPEDRVEISVFGEEMTREIVVRPDGKISYLLVGEVDALGLTLDDLRKELERRLSEYIVNPRVTVIGTSFAGNFVSILGAVHTPGRKVVSKNDHVLDVISMAGGLRFEDITVAAGVGCSGQASTGAVLVDVDGDGDLDLLVNGLGAGTRLFLNDGQGKFLEKTDSGLVRDSGARSLALADIDGDGDIDLYIVNYRRTTARDGTQRVGITI